MIMPRKGNYSQLVVRWIKWWAPSSRRTPITLSMHLFTRSLTLSKVDVKVEDSRQACISKQCRKEEIDGFLRPHDSPSPECPEKLFKRCQLISRYLKCHSQPWDLKSSHQYWSHQRVLPEETVASVRTDLNNTISGSTWSSICVSLIPFLLTLLAWHFTCMIWKGITMFQIKLLNPEWTAIIASPVFNSEKISKSMQIWGKKASIKYESKS